MAKIKSKQEHEAFLVIAFPIHHTLLCNLIKRWERFFLPFHHTMRCYSHFSVAEFKRLNFRFTFFVGINHLSTPNHTYTVIVLYAWIKQPLWAYVDAIDPLPWITHKETAKLEFIFDSHAHVSLFQPIALQRTVSLTYFLSLALFTDLTNGPLQLLVRLFNFFKITFKTSTQL